MFSIQDLMGQLTGGQNLNQMSQTIGAEPSAVQTAVQMALPALIGGMAQRAQQPEVGNQITNQIVQEQGGILDNLGGFLGNPQAASGMGGNILSTILGGGQGAVAQQISNQSGLSMGQVASLLMMLAPIVMSYFGRQQTQGNLDQGGILDMLGGAQQQAQQQSPFGGMLGNMLDRNNDGSSMDDLASLAMQYLGRR